MPRQMPPQTMKMGRGRAELLLRPLFGRRGSAALPSRAIFGSGGTDSELDAWPRAQHIAMATECARRLAHGRLEQVMRTLRCLGWGLLLGGFLWVIMSVTYFPDQKYAINESKRLPANAPLTEERAYEALRSLGQRLARVHREVLIPVSAMLLGGILLGAWRGQDKAPPIERTQP